MTIPLKSKNIYIIRHGQTDYNLNQMVQGRGIDSSLNATGRQQADFFYEKYKQIPFDKIYTSSLKRTMESVAAFIADGLPHESLAGLDEISWGRHEGLQYDSERHRDYLMGLEEWRSGNLDYKVADGESPNEIAARQKQAMRYIMNKENDETILIATHGRAMRFLICWMLNKPLHLSDEFEHSNLCLYHIKYDGQKAELIRTNDVSHLR